MSLIQKIFLDPKHRKRGLVLAFSIFGISISLVTGTLVYHFAIDRQSFPEIAKHTDLTKQPLTTFSDSQSIGFPNDESGYKNSSCQISGANWISDENAKPGVSLDKNQWADVDFRAASGSALWINQDSVSCGDIVQIHASLYVHDRNSSPERTFHALRVGWYNGAGARELWSSKPIKLKSQRVLQPKNNLRMVDTKWPVTTTFQVGNDWTPGFYLIVSEDSSGKVDNLAPLVVRAPRGTSKVLLSHSFLTWNLYNSFGGRSAYFGNGSSTLERRNDRSRVVSMDRPMLGSGGFSIHRDAVSMVQFLEKNGINYDQESDLNIDKYPSILKDYNELVLSGHAEYMTRRIFDSIIAARNDGVNLAIFGGNTALWQTRLTESPIGKDRRIIMYRYANEDPISDLRQVTIEYKDVRLNIPQTLFTGTQTTGVHVYGDYKAVQIPSWLHIPKNSTITGISPDSEIEARFQSSLASPSNVKAIFAGSMHYADPSTIPAKMTKNPLAEVVWFTNPNGQATFNAGVTTWACNLVDTCAYSSVDEKSRQVIDEVTKEVIVLFEERGVGSKLKN
jgi:hypothetical protein